MSQPRTPALTVDVVIPSESYLDGEATKGASDAGLVLVKREKEPFEGAWALPGGFVEVGESTEDAAVREVREETGLEVQLVRLVGVYSEPDRDPRGHNVSVAYLAQWLSGELRADTDASEARLRPVTEKEFAFDHRKIIDDAMQGT